MRTTGGKEYFIHNLLRNFATVLKTVLLDFKN